MPRATLDHGAASSVGGISIWSALAPFFNRPSTICAYPPVRLVTSHGHQQQQGGPTRSGVTSRMLEQLTYAQIGERLKISSEGARAIVKRSRLPRLHASDGKTLVAIDLDELSTNHCPPGHHAASR
jgi:hypothetical protein